jgi:tetratricopeptide (TPR) repeat protein
VTARTRVAAVVAVAATAAAAAVVGVTLLQTRGEESSVAGAVTTPREGNPPLLLDFGVRTDPAATALRRAAGLYAAGRRTSAGRIFGRYRSLDAQIGAAFVRWPEGTLDRMKELVTARPASATAQLHLGLAQYWSGRLGDAVQSWRRAEEVQPDTPAAVHAQDLLHPRFPRGLPPFIPSEPPPPELERLPPGEELAALARAARRPDAHAKVLYGVALQQLGRPLSAERQFAAAARLAPNDPEARVAAAVGRFTKDAPQRTFSRLGPLTRVFPHAPTVRFHLGVTLLWLGEVREARRQLRLARAQGPNSAIGKEAKRFLDRLARIGTK